MFKNEVLAIALANFIPASVCCEEIPSGPCGGFCYEVAAPVSYDGIPRDPIPRRLFENNWVRARCPYPLPRICLDWSIWIGGKPILFSDAASWREAHRSLRRSERWGS